MARFDPRQFNNEALLANDINVAFGVPDSSLSGLLSYFSATKPESEHIVTASEGAAIALAAGYYLATRNVALAYVQNSGLSNALNPLQSLAAKEVFGIPMLVMVGWRGKPGEKDEPQHALIGPRLLDNLRANDFPFEEIPDTLDGAKETIARLVERSLREKTPVALIVPRNTFAEYESDKDELAQEVLRAPGTSFVKARRWLSPIGQEDLPLSREFTIRHVLEHVKDTDASVSSLGGNSRELYMIRKEKGDDLGPNFFCIGAMGHAFALAHGLALGFPSSRGRVWCIDGDGSFLMHIGNNAVLAGIGTHSNVVHIVIFNAVYSSTGSQPLMISPDNFLDLAEGLPYRQKVFVDSVDGLQAALLAASGGTLIVVVVNDWVSKSLPRPKETVEELRGLFLKALA